MDSKFLPSLETFLFFPRISSLVHSGTVNIATSPIEERFLSRVLRGQLWFYRALLRHRPSGGPSGSNVVLSHTSTSSAALAGILIFAVIAGVEILRSVAENSQLW